MVEKREIDRLRAQNRRSLAKAAAKQKAEDRRKCLNNAVEKARMIIAEESFVNLAFAQGIKSVPLQLVTKNGTTQDAGEADYGDQALDFVVAWKFLFPLFSNPAIANHLDANWPGFILELKDTFISLVMYGPFPNERRRPMRANFIV